MLQSAKFIALYKALMAACGLPHQKVKRAVFLFDADTGLTVRLTVHTEIDGQYVEQLERYSAESPPIGLVKR